MRERPTPSRRPSLRWGCRSGGAHPRKLEVKATGSERRSLGMKGESLLCFNGADCRFWICSTRSVNSEKSLERLREEGEGG